MSKVRFVVRNNRAESIPQVELFLVANYEGEIVLAARNSKGGVNFILDLNPNGIITRREYVADLYGFQTDDEGKVIVV